MVESIYAELEDEWSRLLGPGAVTSMRTGLMTVLLAAHDGELPALSPA